MQVADSYVLDERVGFAEPAPGMEIYFCPPHTRTLEMISKHLFKDQSETTTLNSSTDNGLIGVVVWRKAHLTSSTISPNSSSLHKHGSKKQHFSTRKHEKDATTTTNMNSNFMSGPTHSLGSAPSLPEPSIDDDDDDDIPPGFGPGASRDEDDLPEFQFSGSSNISSTTNLSSQNHPRGPGVAPFNQPPQDAYRPVEQMRQLIQKYGQSGSLPISGNWREKSRLIGHGTQPWAGDDDDDIPEWQPQPPQQNLQPPQPTPPIYSFQQMPQPQPLVPLQSMQQNPPTLPWQHQQQQGPVPGPGPWWVPPSGPQGPPPVQYPGTGTGQTGMNWRHDVPRSRGF